MTSTEKIVIILSEGSWVAEKTIYTLIVEPAPAFLGRGVVGLPKNRGPGAAAEKKSSFLPTAKKVFTLLPIVQPWTSDNNYSTKLATDSRSFLMNQCRSAADPAGDPAAAAGDPLPEGTRRRAAARRAAGHPYWSFVLCRHVVLLI